jgi:hypothetical protein
MQNKMSDEIRGAPSQPAGDLTCGTNERTGGHGFPGIDLSLKTDVAAEALLPEKNPAAHLFLSCLSRTRTCLRRSQAQTCRLFPALLPEAVTQAAVIFLDAGSDQRGPDSSFRFLFQQVKLCRPPSCPQADTASWA